MGYPSQIQIQLPRQELTVRCYFIDSDIIPLLGRIDIWDKFSIIFDNIKKEVVFKEITG